MNVLSTKFHGMLDYLMGALLIAAPWLLGFAEGGAETYVPVALGAMMLVQALLTDYEMGLSKLISMRTHLLIDLLSGAFLAASPWIFNFDERVYLPHLIFGVTEILVSLFTDKVPYRSSQKDVYPLFR